MPTSEQGRVTFCSLTASQFESLMIKSPLVLYFVTDRGELYKGNVSYSRSVKIVETFPVQGENACVYLNVSNGELRAFFNGQWIPNVSLKRKISVKASDLSEDGEFSLTWTDATKTLVGATDAGGFDILSDPRFILNINNDGLKIDLNGLIQFMPIELTII